VQDAAMRQVYAEDVLDDPEDGAEDESYEPSLMQYP
jgi:hypothetical protein